MPELFASSAFRSVDFGFLVGIVEERQDGYLRLVAGQESAEFWGEFSYGPSGVISGRIEGYRHYAGSQVTFELAGLSVSVDNLSTMLSQTSNGSHSSMIFSGSDYFIGSGDSDQLNGLSGDDRIEGGSGDDVVSGGQGNDTIDGGVGSDIASYNGPRSSYTVQIARHGVVVSDRVKSRDGEDVISNIEVIRFEDRDWELSIFDSVTGLTSDQFSEFAEMYIAYFNRAPDSEGLLFWANALTSGVSIEQIAELFFDQPETRALYPDPDNTTGFVEAVYGNVLGRQIDQAGFDFWVGVLSTGAISRAKFVLEIIRGAKADPPPGASTEFRAQKSEDVKYLSDKADLGIYFSAILGMSDVPSAIATMGLFDGSAQSLAASKAEIDRLFEEASSLSGGEFLVTVVGVVDNPFDSI